MSAPWGCSPSPRLIKVLLVSACALLILSGMYISTSSLWFTTPHSIPTTPESSSTLDDSTQPAPQTSKYAFATILTGEDNDETDLSTPYFTAARILTYQLLHSPDTKGAGTTPFLVMVTENVPQKQRDLLIEDGAIVVPVDRITSEWVHPKWERWSDVLAKLNIWKQTEYDKIAFIDADTVLFHPIDSIFSDQSTKIQPTLPIPSPPTDQNQNDKDNTTTTAAAADAPVPKTYLIAGIHDLWVEANLHPDPGSEWDFYVPNNYMNAGFFVLSPSEEMFRYYLSILQTPDRFNPAYPEQNLLNLAHRVDGAMPWRDIGPGWSQKGASRADYDNGLKCVHQKWWESLHDEVLDGAIANATAEFRAFVAARGKV